MVADFLLKIRRRETPFYDRLYHFLKDVRSVNMPVIRPLYALLDAERRMRKFLWSGFIHFIYYEPLFKYHCAEVGKGLQLIDGLPQMSSHLTLILGDHVTLHGTSTFIGAKVFERPTLKVGNHTHLGSALGIVVGCDVTIGDHVLIANGVNIFSYDQHPANPAERHLPAAPSSSRPVVIEDNVWIGTKTVIMKGVTIGRNSIVASSSVVTQKVPPNSLAIGNPARIFPLIFQESPTTNP
jgi:UDP-3-O-[3-hydroxymyristoyl] glucosamine N-acyltransferase